MREWYDIITLANLTIFFVIEAMLLWKRSPLSYAMALKCLFLALVFGSALFIMPHDASVEAERFRTVLRVGVNISLVWAVVEMVRVKIKPPPCYCCGERVP